MNMSVLTFLFSVMDFFYSEKQSGFETRDSSHYMSRSMRSMAQQELADRSARCISPAADDSKLRNPQRRRVPVAVCISHSHFEPPLTLIVSPVSKEKDQVQWRHW